MKRKLSSVLLGVYLLGTLNCSGPGEYTSDPKTAATVSPEEQDAWKSGGKYAGPGGSAYTQFAPDKEERAGFLRKYWGEIAAGVALIGAGAGFVVTGKAIAEEKAAAAVGGAVAGAVAEQVVPEILAPPATIEIAPPSPSSITPDAVGEVVPDEILGDGMRYVTRRELDAAKIPAYYAQQFLELQDTVMNWHLHYTVDTSINPETLLRAARTSARRLAIEFRNRTRFSRQAFSALAESLDRLADWAEEEVKLFHPPQRSSRGR